METFIAPDGNAQSRDSRATATQKRLIQARLAVENNDKVSSEKLARSIMRTLEEGHRCYLKAWAEALHTGLGIEDGNGK